jgi:hypothetical protein
MIKSTFLSWLSSLESIAFGQFADFAEEMMLSTVGIEVE